MAIRRAGSLRSSCRCAGFVRARLDAIAELGECDIVAELFRPVPAFVVAGYLGVPETDQAPFGGLSRDTTLTDADEVGITRGERSRARHPSPDLVPAGAFAGGWIAGGLDVA